MERVEPIRLGWEEWLGVPSLAAEVDFRLLVILGRFAARRLRKEDGIARGFYFHYSGIMEMNSAISGFAALAHPLRLSALRALIAAGEDGLPAGEVARLVGRPANTLSAALSQLERAGLVASVRDGRQMIYRAEIAAIGGLADWLVQDCCGGHPEACFPRGAA